MSYVMSMLVRFGDMLTVVGTLHVDVVLRMVMVWGTTARSARSGWERERERKRASAGRERKVRVRWVGEVCMLATRGEVLCDVETRQDKKKAMRFGSVRAEGYVATSLAFPKPSSQGSGRSRRRVIPFTV